MDRLRTKRTVLRGRNTRVINEAKALLDAEGASTQELTECLERLTLYNTELRQVNCSLEPLFAIEDLERELTTSNEYDELALKTLSMLNTSSPVTSGGQEASRENRRSGAKLPKLEIPKYNGDLCSWQPFWEQFRDAIHTNRSLPQSEKFHYLRALSTGPAAAAIAGLQVTEACYEDALSLLKNRFGDKGRIEKEYLSRLRHLPTVISSNDVSSMTKLYDYLQANIRDLTSLGTPVSSYATMMSGIVLRSFPSDVAVDFHRRRATRTDPNKQETAEEELNTIIEFLKVEVESRERSNPSGKTEGRSRPPILQGRNSKIPSANVLQTSAHQNACFFCGSLSHPSTHCDSAMSLERKKEKLKVARTCFRCTFAGHVSRECRRKVRCTRCQGRHVTTMCDPSWKPSKTQGTIDEATSAVCSSPAECNSSDTTYLQTFRAWAVSSNDCLYVRGLFDSGSQRSFIREDVAETLKLPVTGEIEISINAFASTCSKPVRRKLVQFKLRSQFHNEEAIVVPVICKEIFVAPVPEEHLTHLEVDDIDVADAVIYPGVPEVSGISVLVGADQIWQLLTGEIKRSRANCNLVAMNSKLGWTFLGPSGLRGLVARQSKGMVCVLHSNVQQECFPSSAGWKKFWELENIGIVDDLEPPQNNSVLNVFKGSIARN
ncbi:uncharacterized protein LOC135389507 [Ornithodoros turicata]|uniref:uncharacterized protein LOC135389507 n=1 Tax=Ornithodoros turicata TaxID=34597 RepID=UPI0031396566